MGHYSHDHVTNAYICVPILITQVTDVNMQHYSENLGHCPENSGSSVAKVRFYDIHSV